MNRPLRAILTTATLLVALALPGCGSSPTSTGQSPDAQRNSAQPSTVADTPRPALDPQLQAALDRLDLLERDNRRLQDQLRRQELDEIELRRAQLAAQEQAQRVQAAAGTPRDSASGDENPEADQNKIPTLATATRQQLLDALHQSVVASDDSARVKALNAAALSLLASGHNLDRQLLAELDPRSREQVARFHQMIAVTYDQVLADPDARLDLSAMIDRVSEVIGEQPLSIKKVELCRRVDGYGIYEAFEGHRFPAGQLNRTLVYIEIEDFLHQPTIDNEYEVKVSVELELYDRRGEVLLWRQQPETITDVSRNQRRDFFLIQPVNLPASLGAGEYRLKVRVKDQHSGSLAESTITDLQLLADESLVGQRP